MNKPKRHWGIAILQLVMFTFLFLLHYSGLLSISSLHANPLILLPFLVAYCMFAQELSAALSGMLVGIFMDAFSSSGSYFHTILFFIIGCTVSVLVHYLLNNNFRTGIMLSLVATLFYFALRWLFFHAFTEDITNSAGYLMRYALPSVIYTNLFIIPFYFLQSFINRRKSR